MARKSCRVQASAERTLTCVRTHCGFCGHPRAVAYRTRRTITTLQGSCWLTLRVRRCRNPACEWYHRGFRPEEEGKWALPHGEFGRPSDCAGWHVALYLSTFAFLKFIRRCVSEEFLSLNGP